MVDGSWTGRFSSGVLNVLTGSARSGFDSLRQITQQDPSITKEIEIYVDGGARRGTDVLMALALGAKGVGLGDRLTSRGQWKLQVIQGADEVAGLGLGADKRTSFQLQKYSFRRVNTDPVFTA